MTKHDSGHTQVTQHGLGHSVMFLCHIRSNFIDPFTYPLWIENLFAFMPEILFDLFICLKLNLLLISELSINIIVHSKK